MLINQVYKSIERTALKTLAFSLSFRKHEENLVCCSNGLSTLYEYKKGANVLHFYTFPDLFGNNSNSISVILKKVT